MNCNIQKKKGKILGQFTLNAYSDEPALPDISPDDAGKALVVDESGNIVAGEIGSGSELYLSTIEAEIPSYTKVRFNIVTSTALSVGTISSADFIAILNNLGFTSVAFPVNAVDIAPGYGPVQMSIYNVIGISISGTDLKFEGTEVTFISGSPSVATMTNAIISTIKVLTSNKI